MAKIVYVCQECGHKEVKWQGCCSSCRTWNSFIEISQNSKKISKNKKHIVLDSVPVRLSEIQKEEQFRIITKLKEVDIVFGGGITKGSLCLIGGEPGIGKSTLLIQLCGLIAEQFPSKKVLYISGEESLGQISSRCERLKINNTNISILHETSWQKIAKQLDKLKPIFIVLDSIQTTTSNNTQSIAGSSSQIKEVTYEFMNHCKAYDITAFIIGHITKDGSIAGPKLLEHMVDTVISFEGEKNNQNRFLRVIKNRFGSTNEVGVLRMCSIGLTEITNPSFYFLNQSNESKSLGRTMTCLIQGGRPLLAEIQTLVVENQFGNPKRTTQGYDQNRLSLIIAVIEKYLNIPMGHCDIYINTAGGLKIRSNDTDLSMVSSLLSSYLLRELDSQSVYIGEVSLTGDIRAVVNIEDRLKEVYAHGYKKIIMPESNLVKLKQRLPGVSYIGVKKIKGLVDYIF